MNPVYTEARIAARDHIKKETDKLFQGRDEPKRSELKPLVATMHQGASALRDHTRRYTERNDRFEAWLNSVNAPASPARIWDGKHSAESLARIQNFTAKFRSGELRPGE